MLFCHSWVATTEELIKLGTVIGIGISEHQVTAMTTESRLPRPASSALRGGGYRRFLVNHRHQRSERSDDTTVFPVGNPTCRMKPGDFPPGSLLPVPLLLLDGFKFQMLVDRRVHPALPRNGAQVNTFQQGSPNKLFPRKRCSRDRRKTRTNS